MHWVAHTLRPLQMPHPVTAAGNHFGGGAWLGIRRLDLLCIVIMQWCIAHLGTSEYVRLQSSRLFQYFAAELSPERESRLRHNIHKVSSSIFVLCFSVMIWQLLGVRLDLLLISFVCLFDHRRADRPPPFGQRSLLVPPHRRCHPAVHAEPRTHPPPSTTTTTHPNAGIALWVGLPVDYWR